MLYEGVEIAIAVEQRDVIENAAAGDEGVDRLADGDALSMQLLVVARGLDGDSLTNDRNVVELTEPCSLSIEIAPVAGALKDFDQHEVTNRQSLFAKDEAPARFRLESAAVGKEIDPNA